MPNVRPLDRKKYPNVKQKKRFEPLSRVQEETNE
jgi:hypothetical protein